MGAKYYLSTDVGAPVIGYSTPGSLIAVLKACLVDGYGSKAPAGWTMPFTGTNQAVFRMGGGGLRYLYIDDSPTGGYAAPVRAYDTMSGLTTGTGMFPTAAQVTDANARWWRGSGTSSTKWVVVATESFFYAVFGGTSAIMYFFGDANAVDTLDDYCTILSTNGSSATIPSSSGGIGTTQQNINSYSPGAAAARSYDQASVSITSVGFHVDYVKNGGSTTLGNGGLVYPNTPDGEMYMSEVFVHESNPSPYIRAKLPSIYSPCNANSNGGDFADGNIIIPPSGQMAGMKFLVVRPVVSSSGCALFDVTGA